MPSLPLLGWLSFSYENNWVFAWKHIAFWYKCFFLWHSGVQWPFYIITMPTYPMYWSSKMLVRYILSIVCLWLSQFCRLSFIQYLGLCVFSLPTYFMMIVCTLSYYHHQIGSLTYVLLFRVRSWHNGTRCMSLYVLIEPTIMLEETIFTYDDINSLYQNYAIGSPNTTQCKPTD